MRLSLHPDPRVTAGPQRERSLAIFATVIAFLPGCAQHISGLDGGPDAGAILDAVDSGPRDGKVVGDAAFAPDPDGGRLDAAGADAGLIASPDASLPPLKWGEMSLPSGLGSSFIRCVWGTGSTVYACGPYGKVLRLVPKAPWEVWVQLNESNAPVEAISGAGGSLFVANANKLSVHDGSQWKDYTYPPAGSVQDIWAVSPTEVYFGAARSNWATLFKFDGTAISQLWQSSGQNILRAIAPDPLSSDLLLGATQGAIYRLKTGTGTVVPEEIAYPAIWQGTYYMYMDFRGLAKVGQSLFAVGFRHYIFGRDAVDGKWKPVYSPLLGGELRAVAGFDDGTFREAFAVGTNETGGPMAHWDGVTWTSANLGRADTLEDIYSAGRDGYFACGGRGSTGVILHGER